MAKTTTVPFPFDGINQSHINEMDEVGISVLSIENDDSTNYMDEVVLKGEEPAIRKYIAKLWGFEGYEDAEEIDEIFGIGM